jgi:hypothetical protein
VVKIPSLSRRADSAPTRDENRDGRTEERDVQPVAGTAPVSDDPSVATEPDSDRATHRSRAAGATAVAEPAERTDVRAASERKAAARAATTRPPAATTAPAETTPVETTPVENAPVETARPVTDPTGTPERARTVDADRAPEVVVPAGPRPRASMLATLSLVFGVAGALFVLTGTLAGYGIGLGAVALLLAVGGMSATGRRHVAGRTDALFGLLLGLGAVIVGVLAMTGKFGWPSTDGDVVQRFREWLDSQFVDRF